LLKTEPSAGVEAKLPAPVEPTTIHVAPPLLKTETPANVDAKLPVPVEPTTIHVAPPLLKTETPANVDAKLSAPVEREPVHLASPKTDAPSARKLPPPLPVPQPVQSPEVPVKPVEPNNLVKLPIQPVKAASPTTLPEPPVEAKAESKSVVPLPIEIKSGPAPAAPSIPPPVESKSEPKPAAESEKKPKEALPAERFQSSISVGPPAMEIVRPKPATVTLPTLPHDTKPALRPPVLPDRLAREKEPLKAVTPTEQTAAPSITPVLVTPSIVEAKGPVKSEEKPPVTKALTEVSPAKPAEPEKPKPSLQFDRKLPVQPATVQSPSNREVLPNKPVPVVTDLALTPRAARARKKRFVSNVCFYILCVAFPFALYYIGGYFCHETSIEGQVIPPEGMLLGDEAWIVTDFRDEVAREAEDLADKRTPDLQDIQEKLNHVQRAQADIAAREERVRLLQGQIQAAKDETESVVKQAKDAAQQLWDGPGAQIDQDYNAREQQLSQTIADRAKALKLNYQPDPNFNSPEVWANAYRLALYQVPAGVDSSKELLWLDDQMKQWRDFTKSVDDRKEKLREQVAAVKQSPADKVTDLQTQIDDLQHRIDSTTSEEMPIKTELQQAQADLVQAQTVEAGLDPYFYKQLYSIPETNIIKRLPLKPNGRFSWLNVQNDTPFIGEETAHSYWLFARAVRPDGRQYWALNHITVDKDSTYQVVIEPEAFVSTKTILRPDLSPEEQQQ
jgi:hypothetical protein